MVKLSLAFSCLLKNKPMTHTNLPYQPIPKSLACFTTKIKTIAIETVADSPLLDDVTFALL